jgi:hypothetical protein
MVPRCEGSVALFGAAREGGVVLTCPCFRSAVEERGRRAARPRRLLLALAFFLSFFQVFLSFFRGRRAARPRRCPGSARRGHARGESGGGLRALTALRPPSRATGAATATETMPAVYVLCACACRAGVRRGPRGAGQPQPAQLLRPAAPRLQARARQLPEPLHGALRRAPLWTALSWTSTCRGRGQCVAMREELSCPRRVPVAQGRWTALRAAGSHVRSCRWLRGACGV